MIRYLTEEERRLSRDLWEEAFPEDSRSFDDYYFSEKIKENRILALCADEEVLSPSSIESMIQLNPYAIQAGPLVWKADYLVGVATRKNRRHRGYMRQLLVRMMGDMRREGMPFCFLMPAAEAIYRPFGFTYIFDQPRWSLKENGLTRKNAAEMIGETAGWMNRWMKERYQVFSLRDEAYVSMLLAETASENGVLEALYQDGRLVGVQSIWGLEKREQRLLYAEDGLLKQEGEPRPAIMARIISPEEFVKAVGRKPLKEGGEEETEISLFLEDPLIPENQGLWTWHLTQNGSRLEKADEENLRRSFDGGGADGTQKPEILRLTITELTGWLFGYEIPKAAEPWAGLVQPLQGVFLDEVV